MRFDWATGGMIYVDGVPLVGKKADPERAAALTRESIRFEIAERAKAYKAAAIAFEEFGSATADARVGAPHEYAEENRLLALEVAARDALFDAVGELEKAESRSNAGT